MTKRLLGGLAVVAFTAVLWSGTANARCWWTGATWACVYPPNNTVVYAPPYPEAASDPQYPSFYPFTDRYPGPKLNGG